MPSFQHGAVEIAYSDEGEGDAIVLVHGFASNKEVNWVYPGWTSALRGRRVIALDNRGHGQSSKLYDPADYHLRLMTEDVRALLDHLGIERADVMGYSMGARIAAFLAHDHPTRLRSAILGGIGSALLTGGLSENIADGLEAPSLAQVSDPVGRAFRQFAEQTRSDLRALAACLRGSRQRMTPEEAAAIRVPVLIAVGTKDTVAGSLHELAKLIPGAQVLEIPNRDHMLAVGDRVYKQGVLKFLGERP
jgi:pimeloyl-ACP methyl ester carboxylesterase